MVPATEKRSQTEIIFNVYAMCTADSSLTLQDSYQCWNTNEIGEQNIFDNPGEEELNAFANLQENLTSALFPALFRKKGSINN